MRRFFVPTADLAGPQLAITGDLFHHMVKVLRLKKGHEVLLADGHGKERTGIIDSVGPEELAIRFLGSEAAASAASLSPAITVYQGIPKGDKFEFIVQKATELGAAALVAFSAERSVRKIRQERSDDLVVRWQRIAREAARQSGGSFFPEIRLAGSLAEALRGAGHSVNLLLWEEEQAVRLKDTLAALSKPDDVGVIIGPEGGITKSEAADAVRRGFMPVSLGSRILRTETAGLAMLSVLQFLWGDLGS